MVVPCINQEHHKLLALIHIVIVSRKKKIARGIPPRKIFRSTLSAMY